MTWEPLILSRWILIGRPPALGCVSRSLSLASAWWLGALVPFANEGLSVDHDVRGFLLLCLDMGAVAAMLLAGLLSAATAVNRSS